MSRMWKMVFFDTAKKPFETICPKCKCDLIFIDNGDCDSERAEKVKNTPPYDPTQDPNSPYYIPVVKCPYCNSTDTSKISAMSRVVSTGLFGMGSNKVEKNGIAISARVILNTFSLLFYVYFGTQKGVRFIMSSSFWKSNSYSVFQFQLP